MAVHCCWWIYFAALASSWKPPTTLAAVASRWSLGRAHTSACRPISTITALCAWQASLVADGTAINSPRSPPPRCIICSLWWYYYFGIAFWCIFPVWHFLVPDLDSIISVCDSYAKLLDCEWKQWGLGQLVSPYLSTFLPDFWVASPGKKELLSFHYCRYFFNKFGRWNSTLGIFLALTAVCLSYLLIMFVSSCFLPSYQVASAEALLYLLHLPAPFLVPHQCWPSDLPALVASFCRSSCVGRLHHSHYFSSLHLVSRLEPHVCLIPG